MTSTGLLVVTNPRRIARLLPIIQQQHVNKTLYVQYYPGRNKLLNPHSGLDLSQNAVSLCHGKTIIGVYAQANELCENLDVRILLREIKSPHLSPMINTAKKIEVVIFDRAYNCDEIKEFSQNCIGNVSRTCKTITLESNDGLEIDNPPTHFTRIESETSEGNDDKVYENVVLGGTFDRLHAGHKTLLGEAVLRCTSKLTIGVTDTCMLKTKTLWELVEPCSKRIKLVEEFLKDVDPNICYIVVPIVDPFGPTKDDPELQMIVVSAETSKGGLAVNNLRAKNGLSRLDVDVVDLLNSTFSSKYMPEENEEVKISSSNQRLRLLGTRLHVPVANPSLPSRPYIIGLTGGIASGKTSVGNTLAELGAGLINCDTLAHQLYKPEEPLFDCLVKEFGAKVVSPSGEIDRRALGGIVFQDKAQLTKLNGLVWPALFDRVKVEIQKLYESGRSVVVVEAAVLIQAGWMKNCHEIWACIVPEQEAMQRLTVRNGLSEEEALKRIASQPSNVEQVATANVVISPLWSPAYTRRQVERAWTTLQHSLDGSKL